MWSIRPRPWWPPRTLRGPTMYRRVAPPPHPVGRAPPGGGVVALLLPRHAPGAGGGEALKLGVERRDPRLEPHLVVPLPRAAMGHGLRALDAGGVDEGPHDQGPGEGRAQRADPLLHDRRHEQ